MCASVLAGANAANPVNVYHQIAFYNFFQKTICDSSEKKARVTPSLIAESRIALKKVIAVLKPDLIITWGYGDLVWKWIADKRNVSKFNSSLNPEALDIYTISDYGSIPFFLMCHPSAWNRNKLTLDFYQNYFQKIKKVMRW